MRRLNLGIAIVAAFMILSNSQALAYVIDGSVADWGIKLPLAEHDGYLDTHLPSGSTVDYLTEDNSDIYDASFRVGPGWSTYNTFDAEAFYFDNDSSNIYIAIVQGLQASGSSGLLPGDIGFDINNDSFYEFGLSTINHDSFLAGSVYSVSDWNDPSDFPSSGPWNIASGSEIEDYDLIEFVYSDTAINGHYVLEASIPLNLLGLDAYDFSTLDLHWTQECGNDVLNLTADIDPVPEPATFILLLTGLAGLGGIRLRRISKKP